MDRSPWHFKTNLKGRPHEGLFGRSMTWLMARMMKYSMRST